MNARKFRGANTRDILRQIRDALGPDAVILRNEAVEGGLEITAVAPHELEATVARAKPSRAQPPRSAPEPPPRRPPPPPLFQPADDDENDSLLAEPVYQRPQRRPAPEPREHRVEEDIRPWRPWDDPDRRLQPPPEPDPWPRRAPPPPPEPDPWRQPEPRRSPPPRESHLQANIPPAGDDLTQALYAELRMLRDMMEGQLAGLAWNNLQRREPFKIELLRAMLGAGLSSRLARQLLDRLPPGTDFNTGMRWIKATLVRNLKSLGPGEDVIDRGGIYALIGPTGVGKTTTVAKLAARCTLRHTPEQVVMLTTDSYRIGAHEQLRVYGKIMGVPVYYIKDERDFQFTLSELSDKRLVLIDTVGMSQADQRIAEQIELLSGTGRRVHRLLLISATSDGDTLEDVVRRYKQATRNLIDGCILTKLDEAAAVGGVVDVLVRHQIRMFYVTNGQRVPEDMHLPNAHYLVDRALRHAREQSAFQLDEGDYPLVMGNNIDTSRR